MSLEKFNASIENFEARKLKASNLIQREIMSRVCPPDEEEDCLQQWVDHFAPSFSIIFNEVVDRDPTIVEKFSIEPEKIDPKDREHTIEFFMRELDNLEGPREQAA